MRFKKDNRDPFVKHLEKEIQQGDDKKDPHFKLEGDWKKFLRTQDGFKIFAVDGNWVKENLSEIYNHGGHGLVHEFIPDDEIWISTHHHANCKQKFQKVSKEFFESAVIHEIEEYHQMKKGLPYWKAHQLALEKEKEAGLLKDPEKEI